MVKEKKTADEKEREGGPSHFGMLGRRPGFFKNP